MFSNVVYLNRSGSMVKSCTIPYNLSAPPVPILPEQQHGLDWRCTDSGVSMSTKFCPGCEEEKPISEFGKHGNGVRSRCKICERLAGRVYRALNPDKVKLSAKNYHDKNREKLNQYSRLWRENNPDKNFVSVKRWQVANPEKIREYARDAFHRNHEKARARHKTWVEKNIEYVREKARQWASLNPEKTLARNRNRRALEKNTGGTITAKDWRALLERYDHKCLCCGSTENITMDHVLPLVMGGSHTIDNVQPLCRLCNGKKYTKHIDYR